MQSGPSQSSGSAESPRGSAPLVHPADDPRGRLALALQEVLTVIVRIRADRQVAEDAQAFREHVKRLLGRADQEARAADCDDEHVRLAIYASVAFLDESVLNSPRPMFRDWPGRPLQEEVFGDHMAGETFYRYVDDLLQRQDSEGLAGCLEVFQLCLLLGFRGRYGAGGGERESRIRLVQEKIYRIRGPHGPMAPEAALPVNDAITNTGDPWVRRLGIAALGGAALVLVVLAVFAFALRPGLADIRTLTAGITG